MIRAFNRRSKLHRSRIAGFWTTLLISGFGLIIAWWLVDLITLGQCDSSCASFTLTQTLRMATPIALAAFCGLLCERAGVIDIGIEGKMLTAALFAYTANLLIYQSLLPYTGPEAAAGISRLTALAAAILAAAALAGLHALVSISLKANQIISGVVVNILAVGATGFLYRQFLSGNIPPGPGTFPVFSIPWLADLPFLGPVLFQQKPLTYLLLVLALVLHFILFYTPWGLRTRAAGEHPLAAGSLGVPVNRVRAANVIAGGALAGLAGAWFTLEAVDIFTPLMTNGLGFIGLAALIFGRWTPGGALLGALVFGLGSSVTTTVSIYRPDVPPQLTQMLPYLLTILIISSVMGRSAPPAAAGKTSKLVE